MLVQKDINAPDWDVSLQLSSVVQHPTFKMRENNYTDDIQIIKSLIAKQTLADPVLKPEQETHIIWRVVSIEKEIGKNKTM